MLEDVVIDKHVGDVASETLARCCPDNHNEHKISETLVLLQPHSHQSTAHAYSPTLQCAAVIDVYSPSDLSGMYSRPRSIST